MIDYSRFQLGVDYGPLSKSIQNIGDTLLKKRMFEQQQQQERDIAAAKLFADQQSLNMPKQYPAQFGFGAQPVIDENENIWKPVYSGDPSTGNASISYQPFAVKGGAQIGKNLEPWYPKVGETVAMTDPSAEKARKEQLAKSQAEEEAARLYAGEKAKRDAEAAALSAGAAKEAEAGAAIRNAEALAIAQGLGGVDKSILDTVSNDYKMASKKLAQLPNIEKALKSADTGKWSELTAAAMAWVPGAENEASAMQNLNSLLTSMAGAQIQLNVGVQTDMDFLNALRSNVQSGNTPEANRMIIERIRDEAEYDKYKFDQLNKAVTAGVKPRNFRPDDFETWKESQNEIGDDHAVNVLSGGKK